MSVGESFLWVALLVIFVLAVRSVNQKKKWSLVRKVVGGLVILAAIVGSMFWGWNVYKERPRLVTQLGSISLGMTPVEVTLALGKPNNTYISGGHRRYLYTENGDLEYFVRFSDDMISAERVEEVCSRDYNDEVFGLSKYSPEDEVIKKLGNPTNQSIHKEGLRKMISYPKWKVSFEIEKRDVISVCISEDGSMKYLEEYGI